MKILFLPRYSHDGPSSRYRMYQYFKFFREADIEVEVSSLMEENYVQHFNKSKVKILALYIQRIFIFLKSRRFDLLYIEKELFPFLPPFFERLLILLKVKYIVDYDDAIFHNYDLNTNKFIRFLLKNKIPSVIANSEYAITGSPYLTQYAQKFSQNVVEIPTSIDIDKYNLPKLNSNSQFVIGWIGSKTTSFHIVHIADALRQFSKKYDCVIRLIGFDKCQLQELQDMPIEVIQWSEGIEVEVLNTFSVGIMPLIDAPFERGKCGFKLIQYMACSIPTISTPLEANVKINRDNHNLFATTIDEWVSALSEMYHNREKYAEIGRKNRDIVERYYTVQVNKDKYIDLFNRIKDINIQKSINQLEKY